MQSDRTLHPIREVIAAYEQAEIDFQTHCADRAGEVLADFILKVFLKIESNKNAI